MVRGGVWHGALHQREEWIDRDRVAHRLDEMDLGYLLNVRDYLRRHAWRFHEVETTLQGTEELFGFRTPAEVPLVADFHTPLDWLTATPLFRSVEAEIGRRQWLWCSPWPLTAV